MWQTWPGFGLGLELIGDTAKPFAELVPAAIGLLHLADKDSNAGEAESSTAAYWMATAALHTAIAAAEVAHDLLAHAAQCHLTSLA